MKSIRFVAWGRCQVVAAYEARVREAVEAKYAEELAQAGFLGWLLLRQRMETEIRRELDRLAPRNALYFAISP